MGRDVLKFASLPIYARHAVAVCACVRGIDGWKATSERSWMRDKVEETVVTMEMQHMSASKHIHARTPDHCQQNTRFPKRAQHIICHRR